MEKRLDTIAEILAEMWVRLFILLLILVVLSAAQTCLLLFLFATVAGRLTG